MILEAVTDGNYDKLKEAIILQAVYDYRRALTTYSSNSNYTIKECERFFRSDYFELLTDIDPEIIISRIRKQLRK